MAKIYYFYYLLSNHQVRLLNYNEDTIITCDLQDVYKLKKRYFMQKGYECDDEGLRKYSEDFFMMCDQIKNNDVFHFDYLKFNSHESATVNMFKKLCYGRWDDKNENMIDNIEYNWIESCNKFGLLYCEKGLYKNAHAYDFVAQYPSIQADKNFEIPSKKGKELTITELIRDDLQIGFYKVKIISNDLRFKKCFAFSSNNVYTHIDLLFAYYCRDKLEYDITIDLIICEKNCYIYGKGAKDGIIRSSHIFHEWFRHLSSLKTKFPKNKLVKNLMSSLWGRLVQFNRKFMTEEQAEEEDIDMSLDYNINHRYFVRNITQSKGEDLLELIDSQLPYRYNLGRIKPFLLAKSRSLTGSICNKYINDVVRVCVDNITFKKEHDDVIYEKGTYKLIKEDKLCGKVQFRNARCYKNFTLDQETKNFKDEYIIDDLDEDCFEE